MAETMPEMLRRLAGMLSASSVPLEPLLAACGVYSHDDSGSAILTPRDDFWREIRLIYTPRRDAPAELQLTPAAPVAVAAFNAWFPVYTEVVSKRVLPRRFVAELSTPEQPCRVSLVARVERETITSLSLLREPRR